LEWLPRVPKGCLLVSESGIRTGEDAARLAAAGVRAVLVGEALMRSTNVGALLRDLQPPLPQR
jgi:indole-3-glycerol phosphate synthase